MLQCRDDRAALQAAIRPLTIQAARSCCCCADPSSKECEARMALASLLAAGGDGGGAIRESADVCERLEKLAIDKAYKAAI